MCVNQAFCFSVGGPGLVLSNFHLFGPVRQHLDVCQFLNNKVGMAVGVCEWLRMQEPDFYYDRIFQLMPRWGKCISLYNVTGI
jgi:hypothetical protein